MKRITQTLRERLRRMTITCRIGKYKQVITKSTFNSTEIQGHYIQTFHEMVAKDLSKLTGNKSSKRIKPKIPKNLFLKKTSGP